MSAQRLNDKPNERFILIYKGIKGKDQLVDAILENPEGPEGLLYQKVRAIYDNKIKKRYLEACLIASNDLKKISELLETPLDVVELYYKIHYEVGEYDRLSKLDLLEKSKDNDEMVLKTWALHQGLDFIAWRLGKKVDIQPIEGLTDLFNTCMYKSKEAMFNANSSTASIESTKWVKLSLDIARLLKIWVLDSEAAKKDLELAIKEVVPAFRSVDDLLAEAEKINGDSKAEDDEDDGNNNGSA